MSWVTVRNLLGRSVDKNDDLSEIPVRVGMTVRIPKGLEIERCSPWESFAPVFTRKTFSVTVAKIDNPICDVPQVYWVGGSNFYARANLDDVQVQVSSIPLKLVLTFKDCRLERVAGERVFRILRWDTLIGRVSRDPHTHKWAATCGRPRPAGHPCYRYPSKEDAVTVLLLDRAKLSCMEGLTSVIDRVV